MSTTQNKSGVCREQIGQQRRGGAAPLRLDLSQRPVYWNFTPALKPVRTDSSSPSEAHFADQPLSQNLSLPSLRLEKNCCATQRCTDAR